MARLFRRLQASFKKAPSRGPATPIARQPAAPVEPALLELDESLEASKSGPSVHGPTLPLLHALANSDPAQALALFRADSDRLTALLPPPAIFKLGALLAKEREIPLAINTLKRAAYANDPVAARALFLLARLYTDVRNDYDSAETHLRTLLRKFPQSPEAQGAEQMLKRLGYGAGPVEKG